MITSAHRLPAARGRGPWALLLLCLLGAAPAARAGEVELTASVDRDEIGLDETVRLDITVTEATRDERGELQLPVMRDFDIVDRSNASQSSFAFVNGTTSIQLTTVTSLTLSPHRAGALTIEPARLIRKGKTYTAQTLTVKVLPAGQRSARQQRRRQRDDLFAGAGRGVDPFEGVHASARDLTLKATVDAEQPFVGQQVTYTLWLLTRVAVSSIEKLQLPKMDGFWTEELESPQQLVAEPRVVDGVPMQAYLLRRRAIFPLRPGKVTLDAAEADVVTGMGLLFSRSSVKRESAQLTLDVQPLPAAGRPARFDAGNVGQWSFSATADPLAATVGQPVTLRLVAQGRGNLRDLQLPKLPAIPGLRAYDATTSDKANIDQGRTGGVRTVEQLLVPERTGELEIPALTLETFDPVTRDYKTLRTEPLRLTVGPAAAGAPGTSLSTPAAQNLLAGGGLRPIRLHLHPAGAAAPPWGQIWFWPALLLPPLLAGFGLAWGRARRALVADEHGRRSRLAASAARKRLRGAEALLGGKRPGGESAAGFYAEVTRALEGYLADRQGLSLSGLTREELTQALRSKGHGAEIADKLVSVLDECDRARFAPGARSSAAQEAVLQRAEAVLAALEAREAT